MTRPAKQLKLLETLPVGSPIKAKLKDKFEPRTSHGGNPAVKKRKTARPFSPMAPLHLVLKSKRATSTWSLLHRKNKAKIASMIYGYGNRFKVRVYVAANAGNHLHLLVKAETKKELADFLRVLAGRIAVTVTGAQKGVKRIGKFWDYLYWSRLVNWGRDFYQVRKYVKQNEEGDEAENRIPSSFKYPSEKSAFGSDESTLRPTRWRSQARSSAGSTENREPKSEYPAEVEEWIGAWNRKSAELRNEGGLATG